jgi:hypothetical protein
MKNRMLQKAILAAIAIFLLLAPEGQAGSKDPLLVKAATLKRNLEVNGFQVLGDLNYSQFVKVDMGQMYCDGELDSCNGFNFHGTYMTAKVPKLPGQADTFSNKLFRIRHNEAVVLVGQTPPPCDYFSYACFLYYRYEQSWGPDNVRKILSAFGDPLNLSVLNTGGGEFNKNIVMVFTSDKDTNNAIRTAAIGAGFPKEVCNTFVIPSSLLKTNNALDDTTDQLSIINRSTLWRDGSSDGGGYVDHPRVVVFRVTPPNTTHNPLPAPKQRVRGSGHTEIDYGAAVAQLREAILKHHPDLSANELTTSQWLMESPLALQTLTNTLGDSADTVYLSTQESFKLSDSPDDFLIAYGVNHQKTNKCTYHNINVYKEFKACGVASAYNHCNGNPDCVAFAGSAWEYLHDQIAPQSDQLYALKIARNCNPDERYCLKVPTPDPPGSCGEGAELDDGLFIGFRAYLEPKTKTGPAYTELLFDKVIHFTPVSPPSLSPSSKTYDGNFTEPVTVDFDVSSKSPGDVTWQAQIEDVDAMSCGIIEPDQGRIPGGNGHGSFTFTANYPGPGKIPGLYYLTITVKDQQGRFSATEVLILIWEPQS